MEDFTYKIIKDFNFTPKFIKKLKYMYICETDSGTKLLKPLNIPQSNINFIYKLKEHIKNNEIFNVDFYYLSNQNLPFVEHNEVTYVLTDFFDFNEVDLKNIEDTKKVILSISKFHSLCQTFNPSSDLKYSKSVNIIDIFQNKFNTLVKINKTIKKQKKFSDFDFLFIKNYDFFYEKCLTSIEILNKNIYLINNKEENFMLCHNNLKEDNILLNYNKIFITNFENLSPSHFIFDISNFILRYIRKKGEKYISLDEILKIYSKYNNIKEDLFPILYAILNFPEKYIDTCTDFYYKKRCFTPVSISNQLENIINLKLFHQEYISKIKI